MITKCAKAKRNNVYHEPLVGAKRFLIKTTTARAKGLV
jgi:hypothetical protein